MNRLKKFDNSFLTKKTKIIAGVDEAGRGPLCGPVVACAIIFNNKSYHHEINDSKKISKKKREELYEWIMENCLCFSVGIISPQEIDDINILQATLKAMKIAAGNLKPKPDLVLIDGNKSYKSFIPTKTVVRGDSKSFSIAAASIIAKVTRDKIMRDLSNKFPNYGWEHNSGYGTKEHIAAIKKYGVTAFHRRSFLSGIINLTQNELQFLK